MRKITKTLLWTAVLAIPLMVACSSVDCALEKKVECKYEFRNAAGEPVQLNGALTVTTVDKASGTKEVTLLNKQEKVSQLSLPMSYSGDEDRLYFTYSDSTIALQITEQVVIRKTNEPVFEGVDCNPRFNHVIESVTTSHHFIDSIVINNKTVDNDPTKVHLHVYLHTAN